jgi:hypothetical protein
MNRTVLSNLFKQQLVATKKYVQHTASTQDDSQPEFS